MGTDRITRTEAEGHYEAALRLGPHEPLRLADRVHEGMEGSLP